MPSERMSSDTNTPLLDADARRRFLIESCDVRGDLVRLGQSRREATANTDYPPVIDRLLGEAFVSAVLLAGTIKFDGRMTFQVRGDGAIHLLVVQVAADASYRGLARWSHVPADDASLVECFGEDARLTITIEARAGVEPYQGIVPLEGDNLADRLHRTRSFAGFITRKTCVCLRRVSRDFTAVAHETEPMGC